MVPAQRHAGLICRHHHRPWDGSASKGLFTAHDNYQLLLTDPRDGIVL